MDGEFPLSPSDIALKIKAQFLFFIKIKGLRTAISHFLCFPDQHFITDQHNYWPLATLCASVF
jgi:hypothetical protein